MKKALSMVLALAVIVSCLSMITVFAADSAYGKNLLTEAESTFTGQTAAPSAWKGLSSDLSIVDDPTEAGNKVLKGTTADTWKTPYIEVGQLIKTAMEGAGLEYAGVKFSMRVYAQAEGTPADAASTVSRMILRNTKAASFCNEKNNNYTMFGGNDMAGVKLNTWYTVEGVLMVSKADLATIDTGDNSWRLCLDSIASSAAAVLIDDVSITLEKYDGAKITVNQGKTVSYLAQETTAGFITEVDGDTARASLIISNESGADFYARLQPSVRHEGSSASWEPLASGQYQLVPAGKSVELAVNVPVSKTINKNGEEKEYSYSEAFIKIDLSTQAEGGTGIPGGTVLYISGNAKAAAMIRVNDCAGVAVKQEELPASVNDLWTPDPVYAEIVNGNAEDGTKGWSVFSQGKGTIEQVEGGANNTAHAIKFTPSGSDQKYESIAFDLGPAIIDDPENGYNGAGVGEYTIKFWAKGEKAGQFVFILNSQAHFSDLKKDPLLALGAKTASYITASAFELTEQWKQYEIKVNVTQEFMDVIKGLYAEYPTAYQLITRFDGSQGGGAFNSPTFSYYVDEVTIEAPNKDSGDETADEVQGVTVKVESADEGAGVFVKFDKFAGHLKDGKMTVKIHNTGKSEIKLVLEARLEDSAWTTVKAGETVTIAPDKVATLTIDCPDKATSPKDNKEYVPFMLLKIEGAKAGDQFTVYGFTRETMETQKPVSTITTAANGGPTANLVYGTTTKACPTGDMAPVAIIAIAAAACVMLGVVVAAKKKKEEV